jgi:hypothetical protein
LSILNQRIILIILIIASLWGCRKEDEFTTDSGAKLSFSLDTLLFDTVFSQVSGNRPLSITKQLWVINRNNKGVKVDIRIAGNQYGLYKINVDGEPATAVSQKEIRGKDSIVIFVQVYLNRVNSNTPFIVTDQLVFETNGNKQDVDLVAYAQDAIYLNNEVVNCASGNLHWTADKPYLIYDSILVPFGCTLTIDAGTKIFSHNQSAILIAGSINVNGTATNPVVFTGDRLDPDYKDFTGQWGSIHLLSSSSNNVITHALIKNGSIGIRVDSLSNNQNPKLMLRHTRIENMLIVGLLGFTADITAINNQIVDNGQFNFYASYGGNYRLYHNTFVSFGLKFNRQNAQFLLDNSPLTNSQNQITAVFPLDAILVNNIIYGNQDEELILNNNSSGGTFGLTAQNNLLRTELKALDVNGNILNKDPLFTSIAEGNYRLDAQSPVKGKGIFVNVLTDFSENPRSNTAPTIGAFE